MRALTKTVNICKFTVRSKNRDDGLRVSTGVLSAVGPNAPFKFKRSSAVSKERHGAQSKRDHGQTIRVRRLQKYLNESLNV